MTKNSSNTHEGSRPDPDEILWKMLRTPPKMNKTSKKKPAQ